MIDIHIAILALDSDIKIIRGDVAYDEQGNEIAYDKAAAETKLAQLQAEETAKQVAAETAKQTGIAKLAKLGLTDAEIKALTGNNL
jgi:hypothetical protein